jgi:hypothetical protein
MKKIISLFKRNYEGDRQIFDEIVPGAEWVIAGEGVPTVKIDGTSCLVQDGVLYKRYDAKNSKQPPNGFIPAQDPDPITGHWPGWIWVDSAKPENQWHIKAFNESAFTDGTYELIGPKVQGNPYGLQQHELVGHGTWLFDMNDLPPRDFVGLCSWFEKHPQYEGIVWYRSNGDMVKIKRRDYGLVWPTEEAKMEVEQ